MAEAGLTGGAGAGTSDRLELHLLRREAIPILLRRAADAGVRARIHQAGLRCVRKAELAVLEPRNGIGALALARDACRRHRVIPGRQSVVPVWNGAPTAIVNSSRNSPSPTDGVWPANCNRRPKANPAALVP
jgi:hypothetical protein